MRVACVRSYPQGPRVWVIGQRVHHGATGCALVGLAAVTHRHRAIIAACGVLLAAHDRRDWSVWFAREGVPAGRQQADLDSELSSP